MAPAEPDAPGLAAGPSPRLDTELGDGMPTPPTRPTAVAWASAEGLTVPPLPLASAIEGIWSTSGRGVTGAGDPVSERAILWVEPFGSTAGSLAADARTLPTRAARAADPTAKSAVPAAAIV